MLVAIFMVVGLAAPTVMASPDVTGLAAVIDDGVGGAMDPEPALVEQPALVMPPARRELRQVVAPVAESPGRMHGVMVFRPPR
jgi:hypothetical protein